MAKSLSQVSEVMLRILISRVKKLDLDWLRSTSGNQCKLHLTNFWGAHWKMDRLNLDRDCLLEMLLFEGILKRSNNSFWEASFRIVPSCEQPLKPCSSRFDELNIHCYTAYDIWYSLLHIAWLREKSHGYHWYDSYDMPSYPWYFSSDELKKFHLKQTDRIWTLILSQWSVPAMTRKNRHCHIHDIFMTNSVRSAHLSVIINLTLNRIKAIPMVTPTSSFF